ncbi:MAG: alpha/beta hydrolase [Planctomycetaceae bacterium]
MGVFGGSSRKLATVPGWDRIARSNHLPWFPPFDSGRWEFLRGQLAEATLETTIQHLRSPLPAESRARLAAVRQPTLLIGTEGEASATTTGQQWLAEQLPNARYETMHSSGLFPHVTHPHRLVKLLRSFLLEEAAGDVPKTAPSTPQPATTD